MENIDLEKSILGGLLLDADARDYIKNLDATHFESAKHKTIFKAIQKLIADDQPVDLNTLQAALNGADINGYLYNLMDSVISSVHIEHHIQLLKQNAHKRILKQKIESLKEIDVDDPESALTELQSAYKDIESTYRSIKPYDTTPDTWEKLTAPLKNAKPLFKTSWNIGGFGEPLTFEPGALTFIAAPTGHGKTTFMLNLLLDAVNNYPDQRHWFFSYEEDTAKLAAKLLNCYANTTFTENHNYDTIVETLSRGDSEYFKRGTRTLFDVKLRELSELFQKGCINIKYDGLYFEQLLNAIKDISKDRAGLICIDYAQLLYKGQQHFGNKRFEELKAICLELKDIAVDTRLPIILACQFNREVKNPFKMTSQRIADASDIEKAANKVLGFWNGNKHIEQSKDNERDIKKAKDLQIGKNTCYIQTLKSRTGQSETWAIFKSNMNRLKIETAPFRWGVNDEILGTDPARLPIGDNERLSQKNEIKEVDLR
jgi:replicative DNA helicase